MDPIQEVMTLATEVFDDERAAIEWLLEPHWATNHEPPIRVLQSAGGYEQITNILLRIKFGVMA
jgi:putative toxin-antitoxin system antitoxin component (TIGR02293 family)